MLTMYSLSSDLYSIGTGAEWRILRSLHVKMKVYFGLKDCLIVGHHKSSSTLLSPYQLTRYPQHMTVYNEEEYYQCTKIISKTINIARFKDTNISNKQVCYYAFPGNSRCLVKLLYSYLSELPPNSSYLYMHPLPVFPDN